MDEITINDVGTELEVRVQENDADLDISTATNLYVILTSPSGVEKERAAALVSGSNVKLFYATVAADIDETGIWDYRGRVRFSATQDFRTRNPVQFRVVD